MSTFNAGAIESTLTLNRSTWTRELRKFKAEIEELEQKTITVEIDAYTDNAYVAMDNLERQLDFLDAQTYEPKVDLATASARTELREIDLMLEGLDNKSAQVDVGVDLDEGGALGKLAILQSVVDRLDGRTINIDVDVDISSAMAELATLATEVEFLDGHDIDIPVDVDMGEAEAQLAFLATEVSALDGRDIDIQVDTDRGMWSFLTGEGNSSNGGRMGFFRLLVYSLIAAAPILAVAISSSLAAVIAIAGALAAAAVPAVLLGGAMFGLIKRFKDTDPSDYTAGMQELADALDAIKDAYNEVLDAIAPQGFHIMAEGVQLVADILPDFIPLLKTTADMIDGVLDSVRNFTKSDDYDEMLAFFGDFGVDMLKDFLKIGGNLLVFFGNLFAAVEPFSRMIMDSLVGMTEDWAAWSQTLDDNKAFQEFLDDAIKYGPMVLDMLGSLFQALINIGDALEPFAGPALTYLTKFFDFVANMDTDQLTVFLGVLSGVFAAIKFGIPLVQGIIGAVQFLIPLITGITLPMLLWGAAIIGIAALLVYLWETNEDFRNGIIDTWNAIKETVLPIVEEIWQVIQDNWGPIKEWAMEIWGSIQSIVVDAFTIIEQVVKGVLFVISAVWTAWGDEIIQIVTGVVQIVGALIKGFFDILAAIFKLIKDVLTGNWDALWDDVLGIGKAWVNMMEGIFNGAKNILIGVFKIIASEISGWWNSAFGPDGFLRTAWNNFKDWISTKFNDAIEGWGAYFKAIGARIGELWDGVFGSDGDLRTAWGKFTGWIEGKWADFVNWLGGLATGVKTAVVGMWDGLRDGFKDAINDIIGWWNNLSFFIDLPNKLPGLPDSITIDTPNLNYLADGGYITSPTVAMIGEGDEPEIVSPVSKMREVVREVISGGDGTTPTSLVAALRAALSDIAPNAPLDLEALADAIAARMLPNLNVELHSDDSVAQTLAEELLFWLRTQGYGGKYDAA